MIHQTQRLLCLNMVDIVIQISQSLGLTLFFRIILYNIISLNVQSFGEESPLKLRPMAATAPTHAHLYIVKWCVICVST
jgi:hypothetical protein